MTEGHDGTRQRPSERPLSAPHTQADAPGAPESDGGRP